MRGADVQSFEVVRYFHNFTESSNMIESMKEPGYVYILTNPSFKEDWVKIGKSSRPVNVRSKAMRLRS